MFFFHYLCISFSSFLEKVFGLQMAVKPAGQQVKLFAHATI